MGGKRVLVVGNTVLDVIGKTLGGHTHVLVPDGTGQSVGEKGILPAEILRVPSGTNDANQVRGPRHALHTARDHYIAVAPLYGLRPEGNGP